MKAVIFAAGIGIRMRPLTLNKPKCLLEVCNYPVLFWQLQLLKKHNIHSVIITAHYLAEQIVEYVEEYMDYENDMNIKVICEPELLGNGGSLKNMQNLFAKENFFLAINGDNLTNMDVSELINVYKESDEIVTCGVVISTRPQDGGVITMDGGIITSFEEKPQNPKSNLVNAGIYVMNTEIFNYFPSKKKFYLEEEVFPNLFNNMKGYIINSYFKDIGTLSDYNSAQLEWEKFIGL